VNAALLLVAAGVGFVLLRPRLAPAPAPPPPPPAPRAPVTGGRGQRRRGAVGQIATGAGEALTGIIKLFG